MNYVVQDDGRYHIPIVALGERLRDNFGLTIREHEHFDPVDNVHSPNSYHYYGEAIDVQDWRDDNINGVDWRTRTGNLENLLKGSGAEVFGPNSGLAGHDTHLHLAADNGIFKLDENQYNYLFGGNAGGKQSTFNGGGTIASAPEVSSPKPQAEAKERAQGHMIKSLSEREPTDYSKMGKAEMNAAYDKMRTSDPAKARVEGMKMHKAFFGK